MKYRKKPIRIDAWPIKDLAFDYEGHRLVPECVAIAMDAGVLTFVENGVYIKTLEGGMFGRLEDMLVRGVQGEFYAVKPDIFAATYEETL